ncbi:SphA family protein [Gilvimarinus chinensis]|uniref:SphA family protein n=1 Tax=Gilvimarinus chinensis TaxID=396005 RepID=UPI00036B4B28|nr:transporter [Gilvimarinus chinensis]
METYNSLKKKVMFPLLGISILALNSPSSALADEGGVSFWLPGQFGSFSAAPVSEGWSLGAVYYHLSADAESSREFPLGGNIVAGLDTRADLLFLAPSYAFSDPIWNGGQLSLSITGVAGQVDVAVDSTLTRVDSTTATRHLSDSSSGIGDLYPAATVRWNSGVHNYMTYAMAGVPVGEYSKDALANIGTNHWALDIGGGYTYLNNDNGREFSGVLGVNYNFENPDTDYQNGVSMHFDWAASQFLSESFHLGLVGYVYQQVTGDSGKGAKLGDFKSSVASVGPEFGWLMGDGKWYLNLKGYYEFDADKRPEGWNTWLTLSAPL